MASLSSLLMDAKSQDSDYFGTGNIRVPRVRNDTAVNRYPQTLFDKRLWAIVGTFTDYMMRKMFRAGLISNDADVIPEPELIASIGLIVRPLLWVRT